ICLVFLALASCKQESPGRGIGYSEAIRLNQIGFYPQSSKMAIIAANIEGGSFYLESVEDKKTVFTGELARLGAGISEDKNSLIADFSGFTETGQFVLYVPEVGSSGMFAIGDQVFEELGKGALKAFYFNRASMELAEEHAGIWARPAGHPDDQVMVHATAASTVRQDGSVMTMPKCWYDDVDYSRYIAIEKITMGTFLSLYDCFPA